MQENLNLFEQVPKKNNMPPIPYRKIKENRMIEIEENIFISPNEKKARISYEKWEIEFEINKRGELLLINSTNLFGGVQIKPDIEIIGSLKTKIEKAIKKYQEMNLIKKGDKRISIH